MLGTRLLWIGALTLAVACLYLWIAQMLGMDGVVVLPLSNAVLRSSTDDGPQVALALMTGFAVAGVGLARQRQLRERRLMQ